MTEDGNMKTCLFGAESGSNFWVKNTLRIGNPHLGKLGASSEAASAVPKRAGQGALRIQVVKSYTNEHLFRVLNFCQMETRNTFLWSWQARKFPKKPAGMGNNLAYAALLLSKAIKTSRTDTMCTTAFVNQALTLWGWVSFYGLALNTGRGFSAGTSGLNPDVWHKNLGLCDPYNSHLSYPSFSSPNSLPFFSPAILPNCPCWKRLKRRPPFPGTSPFF